MIKGEFRKYVKAKQNKQKITPCQPPEHNLLKVREYFLSEDF